MEALQGMEKHIENILSESDDYEEQIIPSRHTKRIRDDDEEEEPPKHCRIKRTKPLNAAVRPQHTRFKDEDDESASISASVINK